MQCARCSGVLRADTRGGRSPRPKRKYYASAPVPPPEPIGIFSDDFSSEPTALHSDLPPVTAPSLAAFIHLYGRSLILCAAGAIFFVTVLFQLTFGVLHTGAVALPFLGALVAGFFISIGLPFKMYGEYRRLYADR